MHALALIEHDESVSDMRWLRHETLFGGMHAALLHYDRDGRLYSCAGLRWAVDCLWNGCELLIARPHLTPANLRATPIIKARIALAEGALRRTEQLPKDRLHRELEALQCAFLGDFLTWLATPDRLRAQGGKSAPRTLASLQARLGWSTVDRLYPVLLRLGGAYEASRPPLEHLRDMRQFIDALAGSGAIQRGKLDDGQTALLLDGLRESFALAERETGCIGTYHWIIRHLRQAHTALGNLMMLPGNAGDADFFDAKHHWFKTGEYSSPTKH